ncbi:MAG: hypothetical protein AB4206_19345 [Xenococcaceae cyanobacterium]
MEFSIVGIRFNEWKNTCWKGQVVPLEVIRSKIPKYEGRQAVTIYDQVLGLIPTNQEKLPIGCRVFATLNTCKNHVKAKVVDKPYDWLSPFSDDSDEYFFSDEFLSDMEDQLCYSELYSAFTKQCSPIRFHEWLLRMGKDEKNVDSSIAYEFMHFREWIETEQNNHLFCGDKQIQAYKEYCKKEKEIASWDSLNANTDIEEEYGRGAWMDEEGAIFDDDGECVGIY